MIRSAETAPAAAEIAAGQHPEWSSLKERWAVLVDTTEAHLRQATEADPAVLGWCRRPRGRQPVGKFRGLRVSDELWSRVEKAARAERKSTAVWIRDVLEKALTPVP